MVSECPKVRGDKNNLTAFVKYQMTVTKKTKEQTFCKGQTYPISDPNNITAAVLLDPFKDLCL